MTNEELLAAIRLIVREEIRAGVEAIEPDDLIVYGPDEDGRVKFHATQAANDNVKVISILTLEQSLDGRIEPLTAKQLASIMMNVGCDQNGNLTPIAFRGYGQTGTPYIDQMTPQTNTVIPATTFFQPQRHVFGPAFPQSDEDRTIASRSKDISVLIKSVRALGSLSVGDGSAFK